MIFDPMRTIADVSRQIEKKQLSPVEVTTAYLAQIDSIDDHINSYVSVDHDGALDAAHLAEKEIVSGNYRGPLHGIPISLKDIIEAKGTLTTGHSRLRENHVSTSDATVVRKLREAGAVILGKNATAEFATFSPCFDLPFPPARNPWNREHVTGGSSSGSAAAVAAGLSMGALGTDSAGSVRIPSANCGVVGVKPTYGRVSRVGIYPLAFSLDTCGPICRSVEDCGLMLDAISGYDPADPTTSKRQHPATGPSVRQNVSSMRIGLVRHFYEDLEIVSDEQIDCMEAAVVELRKLGCKVGDVSLPPLEDFHACEIAIIFAESYSIHQHDFLHNFRDYGKLFRRTMTLGAFVSAADYIQANRFRKHLAAAINDALSKYDVLLTATTPGPAGRMDDQSKHGFIKYPFLTAPVNVTGHPAINVCCGQSRNGLPMGMQFIGGYFQEGALLTIASAYEQTSPWLALHPAPLINLGTEDSI